jgi:hypothetical protein
LKWTPARERNVVAEEQVHKYRSRLLGWGGGDKEADRGRGGGARSEGEQKNKKVEGRRGKG